MSFLKKNVVNNSINSESLPAHVAIIMDGNGRWAKKRGLSRNAGHQEGARNIKKIVECAYDIGIKYITMFAFSSENWSRPKDEVDELMKLCLDYLKNAENETSDKDIRVRVIGDKEGLSKEIIEQIKKIEERTRNKKRMTMVIALNYGGRQDILQAAKKIAEDVVIGNLKQNEITERELDKRLYTDGIPDPDLLIRTSGEMRISNFLIWQCTYTEFYFPTVLWPDFTEKHFKEAIIDYQKRSRRFGGL